MTKVKTVSATYARTHFNEILDRVYRTNEPVIITLRGKAIASIISGVAYLRFQE